MERMTYAGTGVVYDDMDPFKRDAQRAGLETAHNIARLANGEFREFEPSRGESVYLIEAANSYFAHVEEGLGTKNRVADTMYALTGKSYYDQIAQDTVAMIVNDMITLGALPLSVAMHLAVGDSKWFNDTTRSGDLIRGWQHACNLARCIWGCGETPTLKGLPYPVLSGSAMGIIKPKERLIKGNICHGDAIVFFESSGIHANGLTLAREIGDRKDGFWRKLGNFLAPDRFPLRALPNGYLTPLRDGRAYGEALLDPTHIYVGIIEDCLDRDVDIHYAVNITGHGWRKLMRANQPFTYIVETLPTQLPIFDFIQKHGPVDDKEAYGNLNMGAGFAMYIPEKDIDIVLKLVKSHPFRAFQAGRIERSNNKRVIIKPLNIEFAGHTLGVR